MNKYQQLRERINQHCPYLLDLKFGCDLMVKDAGGKKHRVTYASDADYAGLVWPNGNTGSYVEDWVVEILGIPPSLADVLRAINQRKKTKLSFRIVVGEDGLLYFSDKDRLIEPAKVKYNLTKPLADQSDETLSFLLEVIE